MRHLREHRGSALILTLVVLVFAVVVTGSFAHMSANSKMTSAREMQAAQAYYVAEAGLRQRLAQPAYLAPHLPAVEGVRVELPSGGNVVEELGSGGAVVRQVGTYRMFATKLPEATHGPDMCLFETLGTTGQNQVLAAVEVEVTSSFLGAGTTAAFGSNIQTDWTVPGNAGDGQGNQESIWYWFQNGDIQVHGDLRITGTQANIDIENGKFLTYQSQSAWNATPWGNTAVGGWLPDPLKHEQFPVTPFPEPAEEMRQDVINALVPGGVAGINSGWTAVSATHGFKRITLVGSPKARYTGRLNPSAEVTGSGTLRLDKTDSGDIDIATLTLTGDLVIMPNKTIWIRQIVQQNAPPQGWRLTIVAASPTDNYDIWIGQGSANFTPFPANSTHVPIYLGAGSVLWGPNNITLMGDVLPYSKRLVAGALPPYPVGKTNTHSVATMQTYDTMAVISRAGEIKFHMLVARGLLYAGGNITAYYLRLHGVAAIREPLRGSAALLGLAKCHLSHDPSAVNEIGLFGVTADVKVWKR
jgi:uncharacterized protein (UPF0333 family)